MVPAKETAEEQLLRMIEGPSGPPPTRGPVSGSPLARIVEQLRQRLDTLWRWGRPLKQWDGSDPLLRKLRLAQRVFWAVLAGLGLYLVVDLVFVQRRPPTLAFPPGSGNTDQSSGAPGTATEDRLKPLEAYRNAILSRNPFGLKSKNGEGPEVRGAEAKLLEMIKTLVVVGINRGRVPEALIEDTAAQRTYFVKVGDQLNGVTVKAINQQGVILSYEDAETRLE